MKWADKRKMEFNVRKCKLMHVGRSKPNFKYTVTGYTLQETSLEKDLGVIITDDGKTSSQCQYVYNKAIRISGMINRTIRYKERGVMVRLYKSLVRPNLEYYVSAWSLIMLRIELLERVQHRFTRMFKELRGKEYGEDQETVDVGSINSFKGRLDKIRKNKDGFLYGLCMVC